MALWYCQCRFTMSIRAVSALICSALTVSGCHPAADRASPSTEIHDMTVGGGFTVVATDDRLAIILPIENPGTRPISITQCDVSCECLKVAVKDPWVGPGKATLVRLDFEPASLPMGVFTFDVDLFSDGSDAAVARFELHVDRRRELPPWDQLPIVD